MFITRRNRGASSTFHGCARGPAEDQASRRGGRGDDMSDAGLSMRAGAAIFVAAVALAGGIALARGPEMLLPSATEPGPSYDSGRYASPQAAPSHVRYYGDDDEDAPRRSHRRHVAAAAPRSHGNNVCVRL